MRHAGGVAPPRGSGGVKSADSGAGSLSLADVLEQEFEEIRREKPDLPLAWEFDAAQFLKPLELRIRLVEGRDPAARGLAARELQDLVKELERKGAPNSQDDLAELKDDLAKGFNELLGCIDLYPHGKKRSPAGAGRRHATAARFAGLRLRSETRERIDAGPSPQRNRLILEDAFPEIKCRDDARLARVFARVHQGKLAALCLSGGGIRSASFGLGVVQGLARLGYLGHFDYLSTVSGGGYLGAWLSAWMQRAGRDGVIAALTQRTDRPLAAEPAPVSHIRTYSSYLSPRIGIQSADTWTLVAIYLRNLLLNWFVLIPLLASALAVPQLLIAVTRLPLPTQAANESIYSFVDAIFVLLAVLSFVSLVVAVRYVHANRPFEASDGTIDDPRRDQREFMRWCFLPMLGAVIGVTVVWAWLASGKVSMLKLPFERPDIWRFEIIVNDWSETFRSAWAWAGVGALAHLLGWFLAGRKRFWHDFFFILATGALGGLVAGVIAHGLVPASAHNTLGRLHEYAAYVSFAAPALLATVLVFSYIYVGLTSRNQVDPMFEWTARCGAWLLIAIFAWLAACAVVILGPIGFAWAIQQAEATKLIAETQLLVGILGVIAGAATLRQAFVAPIAPGPRREDKPALGKRVLQALGMPIFLVALLALLSYLVGRLMDLSTEVVDRLLKLSDRLPKAFEDTSCAIENDGTRDHYFGVLNAVICGSVPSAALVLLTLVLAGYVFSRRIDTNRFSLHGMYRARLIRTFLGASRTDQERDPNRFTGFDEHDDIVLADCWRRERAESGSADGLGKAGLAKQAQVPFLVVNAALNLVTRDELASQQRKAMSFTFSPLHCGASRLGYRPTRDYGGGLTLGTVVTISGAAASPQMGYHSTPLLAFLLTLFNVRLGWWLGNPGYAGRRSFRDAAPAASVMPIIDEALGRTDDQNPYVYLTDGGHFENLGLYEMVLRRCRWIVVSDAGCDSQGAFEDLGNAIRRIQVDFGIPVAFTKVPIYSRDSADTGKLGATYCAIGRIEYSAVDGDVQDGTLIYIKPAFYGNEPPDVFNYARTSPTFPHESTANQFFTEAQFESYRRLGMCIVEHITPPHAAAGPTSEAGAQGGQDSTLEALVARVEAHLGAAGGRDVR